MNAANAVSGLRLVALPLLLVLAWFGYATAFLIGLAMCLLSDLVDGWLARRLHQNSAWGAKLDSWADLALYGMLPLAVWWLWPDLVQQEARYVTAALVSFTLPIVIGLAKFGRLTSYHTWGAKASSVLIGFGLLLLFVWRTPWLFRIAVVVLALAEMEEIAITWSLPHWRADVPSIRHALQLRRS
ncbi:MAG TPA: CDP-alcohol phosphatidyltransferase family protein [Candidatus Binatia bacterium]|nr:CDP-alcohol phosphatidyltransferase family protein [Candidatus Binatia bacterium]